MRVVDVSSGQALSLSPDRVARGVNLTGRYFSPQMGQLEFVQQGQTLIGSYALAQDDCFMRGRLEGKLEGNSAQLIWLEETICPSAEDSARSHHAEGDARLIFDPAPAGNGADRLFGKRRARFDRSRNFAGPIPPRYDEPTSWTAVRLAAPAPRVPRGSGQASAAATGLARQMATRLEIARRALRWKSAHCTSDPALVAAVHDAEQALAQAQEAVHLWENGDPRRFLQVEYCLGPRLARVQAKLIELACEVPAGLSDAVPDDPPSTWDAASCPAIAP